MVDHPPEITELAVDLHEALSKCQRNWMKPRTSAARLLQISAPNIGPNRFHQNRTVSWLMSIPRSASKSSTLCSDSGYRTYIITTRRMASGELLKYRNGLFTGLLMARSYHGQRRDDAKIWRLVRHDHHEIDPLGACLRDPPRGIKTRAIGIEQQARRHARIERRLTKPAFAACDDLRQIQVLARQSDDELRQMVRRHIIDDRRRQELCLINCPRTKMSAHASKGIKFVPKMPPLLGHAPSAEQSRFPRQRALSRPPRPPAAGPRSGCASSLGGPSREPRLRACAGMRILLQAKKPRHGAGHPTARPIVRVAR